MSKIDKTFKTETDGYIQEYSYITCRIGSRVIITIIILVILCGIGGVRYTLTIGRAQKNAEREVFKNSTAYTEEAAQFLAKSYKEYNDTDKDDEKKAIMEYVAMRYPNLDISAIENSKLRDFYQKCID